MPEQYKSATELDRAPVIEPGHTFGTVTEKISAIVLTRPASNGWFIGFGICFMLTMMMLFAIGYLFVKGIGIWGVTIPIGWGFAIVNFVWWIGIGHAGTLISAILLLLRQSWRNSINRFAEAMTLFAVASAGIFPAIHVGRPWVAYWLFPYPNTMNVWPQFRSPLVWDVFAVSTYATVSALFWFIGLIPDLATLRDRSTSRIGRIVYGILAMGWRGLATPLVISVHTVVSFDFAVGIVPGWHSTIFPPYFVAGAIYAGFAMVLTLTIPLRAFYGLKDFITTKHLENMAKILLATGLMVAYGYIMEVFLAFYSGEHTETFLIHNRLTGPYAPAFYSLWACNVFAPQILWFKRARQSPLILFIVSLIVAVGMWLERFVIIVVSLHRDFLPSSWGNYQGTMWDWSMFLGTIGLFFTLTFLFIRFLPMISIFEMRTLVSGTTEPAETGVRP